VFIDLAATERRRISPTAHHFPASPPLQHLDHAIIVLPGAMLYLAQLRLMVWPCRISRASWSAQMRSTLPARCNAHRHMRRLIFVRASSCPCTAARGGRSCAFYELRLKVNERPRPTAYTAT
jgi:hypothetical protein